jgi:Leucine-rich repeat (LRR) protein
MNFLQQISVPFNDMIGTIPEEYAGMKHLIALEVQNNRLTGTLPDVFFSAEGFDDVTSKLQVLNVGGNLLHGTVSSDLGNMRTLKGLHLFDNSFVGDFPLGLEKLGSLAFSRVNGNEFTGPLPSALGRLGLLTEVWFHDNRFTGPIPTEVGRLLRCTDFRIHNNLGITGNIPDEIFNMKRLKRLDLYQMDLTGPLSTRVGELVELEQLRVSTNRLTGRIPAEIQNLVRLQLFWSQLNLFVGSIPEVICNDVLKFLQADCGPIGSPAVSCRCCSACCDRDSQPQTCLLTESTSG